jgi:hypothetical protein
MAAEALDFAQAALTIEPEHEAAAELLMRLRESGEGVERRAAA